MSSAHNNAELFLYTTKAAGYRGFCVQGFEAESIVHMATIVTMMQFKLG